MTQSNNDQKVFILSELLNLQTRVRTSTLAELQFIIVNEIKNLVNYEQAALWVDDKITALSGVAEFDKQSPYINFLKSDLYPKIKNYDDIQSLTIAKNDYIPNEIIVIPLPNAFLILARTQKFSKSDTSVIEKIRNIYAVELSEKQTKNRDLFSWLNHFKNKKIRFACFIFAAFILIYPFRISVLSPAEIIATDPDLIRAPIEGIIESIPVKPNQKIMAGDTLIIFDKTALVAQKDISKNTLKVAEADLRQVRQEAMNDPRAGVKLSILKGEVEKEKTNLAYYDDLIKRSEVTANRDGVVIFEDVFDWLGRPVSIGERIMLLARDDETDLEIRLPVPDAINLITGTDVLFFSNARPDIPLKATLKFHSYRANEDDNGAVSYRLKAEWVTDKNPDEKRLGLKGTAKIYGDRRPLIWHILRKPFVSIRQFFGF